MANEDRTGATAPFIMELFLGPDGDGEYGRKGRENEMEDVSWMLAIPIVTTR